MHCRKGHALIDENLLHHRGRRRCKICYAESRARAYRRRRARQQAIEPVLGAALETMDLNEFAALIKRLEEAVAAWKHTFEKSELRLNRVERRVGLLHKRMVEDKNAFDKSVEQLFEARKIYEARQAAIIQEALAEFKPPPSDSDDVPF
jgi:hypothetical protein